MAADAGTAVVRVIADTSKLTAQVAVGTEQAAGKLTGTVSKLGQSVTSALTNPLVLAGAAVAGFVVSSINAFEEHQTVVTQLGVAVHGVTTAYEDQATALQNLTGYTDEEILAADTQLARFKLTEGQMKSLIPLVLDYARATGTDAAAAANNIGKALLGNTRALKTIGVQFTATGNTAEDLATIMGALQDRVGGTAVAFGKTAAGQVDILKARFNDLQEALGKAVLPVVESFVGSLQDLITVFEGLTGALPGGTSGLLSFGNILHVIDFPLVAVQASLKLLADQFSDVGIQSVTFAGDLGDLTPYVQKNADAVGTAAELTQQMADAQKAADDATKALQSDLPGLIGAVLRLRDAQHALHVAQQDSSTSAADLHQHELDVINAFLGVKDAFGGLLQDYKNGDATMQQVIAKFRNQAHHAGLSKDQINDLIGVVKRYIDQLGNIPSTVTTNVRTNFSHQQLAEGGIVRRPTFALVGESGPEAVIPLSRSKGMLGNMGGGIGAVTINVNGTADPAATARAVRDELLRIQRNNLTTGVH